MWPAELTVEAVGGKTGPDRKARGAEVEERRQRRQARAVGKPTSRLVE
jgi:hypothetical protein